MPRVQGRKRRVDDDDDDDQDSPAQSPPAETQRRRMNEASDEEDFSLAGTNGDATQGVGVDEMARKLVRLALACEYQRRPIRRADIAEKVLGPSTRQFKNVFSEAQNHLRRVFGMEMVELPRPEKVTAQQKRLAAQKSASQNKPAVASWIVRSILPYDFRHPDIITPQAAPTKAQDATYTAIYTLIISLILLSGGTLPDAKMERYLKKLQLEDKTPVEGYEKTELLLKRMEKEGYLIKIKETTAGEDDIYWLVGPRGRLEVGRDGVRGLTKAVYGNQDEDADEELENKITRSLALDDNNIENQGKATQSEQPRRRKRRRSNNDDDIQEVDEDDDESD